jgi:predicted nucleic acid-binding protein
VIYDTTYFLDLTKTGRPAAFEKGVELFESGVPRRVPSHVVFELFYGVEAAGLGEQRRVQNALMGYPVVPADDRIAGLAGRLNARHSSAGVDLGDCYVGATARVYDEPVLTRNDADFETLGVQVESY